jgi:hypothetical protein
VPGEARVSAWKIWYTDGSTYSSRDGEPKSAPSTGVQVVAEFWTNGRKCVHSKGDLYYWHGVVEGWTDNPPEPEQTPIVFKSGPEMEYEEFFALRQEAINWLHGLN